MKTIYSYHQKTGHQVFVNVLAEENERHRLDFNIYTFSFINDVGEWICTIHSILYNASSLKVE